MLNFLHNMQNKIIKSAKTLGFDLVGFSPATIQPRFLKSYSSWLSKHYEGSMEYMKKSAPRHDLQKILPGAKSVIVLAKNYFREQAPLKPGHGRIARYAYGRDYHKVIKKDLHSLENFIIENSPDARCKSFVDTGPVLERALAVQAGLGNVGKNSCLITQLGSWVFIAEIITTLDLATDLPTSQTTFPLCGRCTRCIDACPAKAIIAPGVIDARKCLSYITIENRNAALTATAKIAPQKSHCLFGCDICQEVCPHNQQKQTLAPTSPKIAGDQLNLKELAQIQTDQAFLTRFAGSPLMRPKRKHLQKIAKALSSARKLFSQNVK